MAASTRATLPGNLTHMTDSTSPAAAFTALGIAPPLAAALEARGFTDLTPVQHGLIDPQYAGRDILVSAQTGSGKTVAFGLLVAPTLVAEERPKAERGGTPRAIVITPTRELANQVREELAWLLAAQKLSVVAVTGGTSITGERRALSAGVDIVVGTPGRLNDHLSKGAINGQHVRTVVLDEADEMLDMGFRDELESILGALPSERRTVMLSATLPREIEDLARNFMHSPARLAIDPQGRSNENITFVAHLVPPSHRVDAVVNILLAAAPDERTMIFVRTRADATDIGAQLSQLGFSAAALQGEMGQRERTQTLDAFRAGRVQALVATDVAARGIDVPEVTCVIHADLPGDPSALTHRSGRTGRAGRQGTSVLLVPSFARRRAEALLRAAGARASWVSPPGVAEIERAAAERMEARFADDTRTAGDAELALAKKLLENRDAETLVALLLEESRWRGATAPREIRTSAPRQDDRYGDRDRGPRGSDRGDRGGDRGARFDRGDRGGDRPTTFAPRPREEREPGSYTMFRVNFGAEQGATASRLLAMVCRRGNVRGSDVGAISIGDGGSTFGVKRAVADGFAQSASQRDTREPHVRIEPADGSAPPRSEGESRAPREESHAPAPRAPRAFGEKSATSAKPAKRDRERERADVFASELEGGLEPAWKQSPAEAGPMGGDAPPRRRGFAADREAPSADRPKRGFDRDAGAPVAKRGFDRDAGAPAKRSYDRDGSAPPAKRAYDRDAKAPAGPARAERPAFKRGFERAPEAPERKPWAKRTAEPKGDWRPATAVPKPERTAPIGAGGSQGWRASEGEAASPRDRARAKRATTTSAPAKAERAPSAWAKRGAAGAKKRK